MKNASGHRLAFILQFAAVAAVVAAAFLWAPLRVRVVDVLAIIAFGTGKYFSKLYGD